LVPLTFRHKVSRPS